MKKFLSNEKVKKILYGILAFVLGLCITLGSICAILRFTVLNKGFLSDTLNNSNYYTDLCDEITDDLINLGDASGLDKSFFEGFIDEVFVREDVQDYINKFYSGEKLKVNPRHFNESLRAALDTYIQSKHMSSKDYSQSNVNYFINEATKIYTKNIELKYFDAIQNIMAKYSQRLTVALVVCCIIAVAACLVFIFTNQWKHKSIRYIAYSVGASALLTLIIPLSVYISGALNKLTIISRSLNDMYTTCLNSLLVDVMIVSGVLFIFYAALIILHNKIRTKAT